MVLQNKYKARASRRYNAARGGLSDTRGRGRGRGAPRFTSDSFPSLDGQEEEGKEKEEKEDGEQSDDSETQRQRQKYAPRTLSSNAWRYAEPSSDEEGEKEEQEEDEVDLSNLIKRVALMDSSRTSNAVSSEQAAKDALDKEVADVDTSLFPLLERRRQRERENEEDKGKGTQRPIVSDEQRKEMEQEGKRLLEEKARQEKHERRARVLQQSAKSISLNIGNARRKPEEGKGKRSLTSRTTNYGKGLDLYNDVEEEGKHRERRDDLDSFLDELDETSMKTKANRAEVMNVQPPLAQSTLSLQTPQTNKGKEDEDFLDSIL